MKAIALSLAPCFGRKVNAVAVARTTSKNIDIVFLFIMTN
jgi:hypothetical protein